jgi:NTP pyrophosphatase (non-canonical NTP hydrolase)
MSYPMYLNHATKVYEDVDNERLRAHEKHVAHGGSMENRAWADAAWLPVLMEEVGEVAHELTYDAFGGDTPVERLRKELVQVAAMACAWIESIDRG